MSNLEQEPVADEENEDETRDHGPWPVTLDENQKPIGLPEGVDPQNVILRLKNLKPGEEPGWEAVNPTKEDQEELFKWRGDMQPRK